MQVADKYPALKSETQTVSPLGEENNWSLAPFDVNTMAAD